MIAVVRWTFEAPDVVVYFYLAALVVVIVVVAFLTLRRKP